MRADGRGQHHRASSSASRAPTRRRCARRRSSRTSARAGRSSRRSTASRTPGMEVWCGMILGFDNDDATIFDAQREFLREARIAHAMVGMLYGDPQDAAARPAGRGGPARPRRPARVRHQRHPAADEPRGAARRLHAGDERPVRSPRPTSSRLDDLFLEGGLDIGRGRDPLLAAAPLGSGSRPVALPGPGDRPVRPADERRARPGPAPRVPPADLAAPARSAATRACSCSTCSSAPCTTTPTRWPGRWPPGGRPSTTRSCERTIPGWVGDRRAVPTRGGRDTAGGGMDRPGTPGRRCRRIGSITHLRTGPPRREVGPVSV